MGRCFELFNVLSKTWQEYYEHSILTVIAMNFDDGNRLFSELSQNPKVNFITCSMLAD